MPERALGTCNTVNQTVIDWVAEIAQLCQPDRIYWCEGSPLEKNSLTRKAVTDGVLTELNQIRLPGCYYHRSNPNDVARVEQCTFICTSSKAEAGPTNNWADPGPMRARLLGMLEGSMKGRTLYVVPYLMGPLGSPLSKVGIELTDSVYVALSMGVMTRMGGIAYRQLGDTADFNRGIHCTLDVNPDRRLICHFPEDNAIISVGSAYGGNVLLGKKCLALRIGSWIGRRDGWMAEHMLILGVEAPDGERTYVAAAFPSACGKTNFAMLIPPAHFHGWKVWTLGDDIAWMKPGPDGRLYAINPEYGYFGVVPGTNSASNPNAVRTIARDTFYTNVGLLPDGDVWWEGKDGAVPAQCLDWKGNPWTPASREKAAHPNSRFAAPMANNPALAPESNDPNGVPISAIIFGGRRATTLPLVFESFDWSHGVYLGASMGSEMTAAAVGGAGQLRRDPMAMLPFCGYDMGQYFQHWLSIRHQLCYPPQIFHVNWFRKDARGRFLWPGFGENMRVLRWIVDRSHGRIGAQQTALGWMPRMQDIDAAGLDGVGPDQFQQLMAIHPEEWRQELASQEELFEKLKATLPRELHLQKELLAARLGLSNP